MKGKALFRAISPIWDNSCAFPKSSALMNHPASFPLSPSSSQTEMHDLWEIHDNVCPQSPGLFLLHSRGLGGPSMCLCMSPATTVRKWDFA